MSNQNNSEPFFRVTESTDFWLRRIFSGGLAAFAFFNMRLFNTTTVIDAHHLNDLLLHRPRLLSPSSSPSSSSSDPSPSNTLSSDSTPSKKRGLLTICNHVSGLDDPCVLTAILPFHLLADFDQLRWTLCATDRCFRSPFWAHVFPHVKCIPIIRGSGIHQPLMDMAVDLLSSGEWINMFPEGTRSEESGIRRFKSGVGRLVADAEPPPYVVPIVHRGMQRMLPLGTRVPRFGNPIEVIVGEPMVFDAMIQEQREAGKSPEEIYAAIAMQLEERMRDLNDQLVQRFQDHS